MPVTIKRASGAVIGAPEETPAPDLAHEQQAEMRVVAIVAMQRFGKGAVLWAENDWQWVEPDWEADPESWPPLAKLLWLFDRALNGLSQAQALGAMKAWYGWCKGCHPDEEKPDWCRSYFVCPDHQDPRVVRAMARALFATYEEANL